MQLYNTQATKKFRRQLRKNLTNEERKIWNLVRNRKILGLKFFRQYSVGKYTLDFYCPLMRFCLEIDGGQHNQNRNDEKRTKFLNGLNIKVLRFWNNDVNQNIEGIYQTIYSTATDIIQNSPQPSL